jgi:transcriptional regulator of acetoin/glycerol metabolism
VRVAVRRTAHQILLTHDWPGNVRELDHCLRQALVAAEGSVVEAADLPALSVTFTKPLPVSFSLTAESARLAAEYEGDQIRRALVTYGGNQSEAARALGIDRRTLYVKMRQLKNVG